MVRHYDAWSGGWVYISEPRTKRSIIIRQKSRKRISQKQLETGISGIGKKFGKVARLTSKRKGKAITKIKGFLKTKKKGKTFKETYYPEWK